ncbi:MAG: hypothetical protein CL928_07855 [Deltaproteobacteria bacterium]|nr:hypothetical protein [Deltaproteobacteria bacterium]
MAIRLKNLFNKGQEKAQSAPAEEAMEEPLPTEGPEDDDDENLETVETDAPAEAETADEPELTASDVAVGAIGPLRDQVAAELHATSPPDDRQFRLALEEILFDIESGMTSFNAAKAISVLEGSIPAWFARLKSAQTDRNVEMSRLIEVMGKALKNIEGRDGVFHDSLEDNLERLREAATGVQVRSASRRLLQLIDGASEQVAEQKRMTEKRLRSLSEMVRGLNEELDQVKVEAQEDALTGLFNRKSFDDRLEIELNNTRLTPYRFVLIIMDLDHFKAVNDTYGHVVGDRVLQACGKAIQEVVMRNSDFCARYGGEEMAVILSDCRGPQAIKIAERIRKAIAALEVKAGKKTIQVTASFGLSVVCDQDTAQSAIERADAALYIAKRSGRNKVVQAGVGEGEPIPMPEALTR